MGAMATALAIFIPSVYGLWFLCSDLVYCILFPQLVLVLYYSSVNTYGSLAGYVVGMLLRLLGGEVIIGLPAAVRYFYYIEEDTTGNVVQLFPFRTFAMLISLFTIIAVSALTKYLFVTRRALSKEWDVFHCFGELELSSLGFPADIPSVVDGPVEKGTPKLLADTSLWREPPASAGPAVVPSILVTEHPVPVQRKRLPPNMVLNYAMQGEDNYGCTSTAL